MSEENEEILFIKVEDGQPIHHPCPYENLKIFFPDLDPSNPPEGFDRFVRVPLPEITPYEVYDKTTYELSDHHTELLGTPTWCDVHHVRPLNPEEEIQMVEKFKELNRFTDWVYDDINKELVPPIPMPEDGKSYIWEPNTGKWLEAPDDMSLEEFIQAAEELGFELGEENHNLKIEPGAVEQILNTINSNRQL